MAVVGHFGCPKFIFGCISGHIRSIGHFGFRKFTFDRNSDNFRSMQFFFQRPFWMSENHFGSHFWLFQIDRPFWMSEIHFRWHFWPFQIHTELLFFLNDKMATTGHFGCPQITFDRISDHFRSIRNFFLNCLQNGRRRSFWIGRQCQWSNSSEVFGWVMHVSSLKNVV